MTVRQAAVVMVMTWLIPIGLFLPWLFVYREQSVVLKSMKPLATCQPAWHSQTVNQVYTVCVVFMTCYVIPLACIAIFYVLIGLQVSRRKIVDQLCTRSAAAASIRRSKSRVLQMLVVVVLLFAVSWLPLYAANLRYLFASRTMGQLERTFLRTYLVPVTQWMGAANSCVNPFIYCYFNCKYRSAIVQLLRDCLGGRVGRLCCRQGASQVVSADSGGGRSTSQAIVMATVVPHRRQ